MKSPAQRTHSGALAEILCVLSLFLQGWDILGRRVRFGRGVGAGEIDIIAWKDPVLAFIEVKARETPQSLAYALTERQRRRIEAGAGVWLAHHPPPPHALVRFDLMTVCPSNSPTGRIFRLDDAWRVEETPV